MNITWAVQTNMGGHYTEDIMSACEKLKLKFVSEEVIPFSDELPKASNESPTIFYGATRWINNIYENNIWSPGVFFNPESILTHWIHKYKENALNYRCLITNLDQLKEFKDASKVESVFWKDGMTFIRPVSDQKEFAGQVISLSDLSDWREKVMTDVPDFGKVPVIISTPVGISHEWRLFIVNGKVSSGSHYREHQKLTIDPDVPKEVIEFAEKRIKEYSPAPVFVMDIGQSVDLYVIEIGCFNSAGFYAADVDKIVYDVSKYVSENY